jgi:hypothetical protein
MSSCIAKFIGMVHQQFIEVGNGLQGMWTLLLHQLAEEEGYILHVAEKKAWCLTTSTV